jgi:hypothetical protein
LPLSYIPVPEKTDFLKKDLNFLEKDGNFRKKIKIVNRTIL